MNKLQEEAQEFIDSGYTDPVELADVYINLACICQSMGVDLDRQVRLKMLECRRRTWVLRDGKLKHIKPGQEMEEGDTPLPRPQEGKTSVGPS